MHDVNSGLLLEAMVEAQKVVENMNRGDVALMRCLLRWIGPNLADEAADACQRIVQLCCCHRLGWQTVS